MDEPQVTNGWRAACGAALAVLLTLASTSTGFAADAEAGTTPPPADHKVKPVKKRKSTVPSDQLIDINRADRAKLKTLPGIGSAEADKIIAGRPYGSKTDLVIRNVLPEGVYHQIKYRIVAIPPDKPKSGK
jgi:DNA uptake protein ComE-like DNA-binding protein